MLCKKRKNDSKTKLVVIGNGFDLWQGLPTSYSNFEKFYIKNRSDILRRLKIKPYYRTDDEGEFEYTDVELLYGDPFDPGSLEHEFWNSFENSLGIIDDERINLYFGKEKSELREMANCVYSAHRILRESFAGWIADIDIPLPDKPQSFGDECIFLNFNYTDTLQKRFGVNDDDIYYIHGRASSPKSIIFGHSSFPEPPQRFLKRLGGRFGGLYILERALYRTDKHVRQNIVRYIDYLAKHKIGIYNLRDVYILGHSFGEADYDYFKFLADTTGYYAQWHISYYSESDKKHITKIMRSIGFDNYKLYDAIDVCTENLLHK